MVHNKQWLFYDRAGEGPPPFYYAFAFMDGPVARRFLQAHLDLLRCLFAYIKQKRKEVRAPVVGKRN